MSGEGLGNAAQRILLASSIAALPHRMQTTTGVRPLARSCSYLKTTHMAAKDHATKTQQNKQTTPNTNCVGPQRHCVGPSESDLNYSIQLTRSVSGSTVGTATPRTAHSQTAATRPALRESVHRGSGGGLVWPSQGTLADSSDQAGLASATWSPGKSLGRL
jgi:hypothetical protein